MSPKRKIFQDLKKILSKYKQRAVTKIAFWEINLFSTSKFWRDLPIIDKENYKKHWTFILAEGKRIGQCTDSF